VADITTLHGLPGRQLALCPRLLLFLSLVLCAGLSGCSSVGVGISVPIGSIGSVGVGLGSDGQVSGKVTVGRGGLGVGLSGTAELLKPALAPAEPTASAPGL
jgi:hypothetical protein